MKAFPSTCSHCLKDIISKNKGKHNFCDTKCHHLYLKSQPVPDAMEKWLSFVDKTPGLGPKGDCWEWVGKLKNRGYGSFVFPRGESTAAHIASYRLHTGDEATKGFDICHTCDNRRCVNPAHLFKGTRKDNLDDMNAKGRRAKGERAANAKLTDVQVTGLRKKAVAGERASVLASEFEIEIGTVYSLIRGDSYGHLPILGSIPTTELTPDQVRELRAKRKAGVSARDLAKEYGFTTRSIRRIVTGERYKHVPLE